VLVQKLVSHTNNLGGSQRECTSWSPRLPEPQIHELSELISGRASQFDLKIDKVEIQMSNYGTWRLLPDSSEMYGLKKPLNKGILLESQLLETMKKINIIDFIEQLLLTRINYQISY